ncbi:MAG: hypothetical protein WCY45_04565 [Acholeplasmataceae bacterium]|jgi:hypothetical protein
MNKDDYIKQFAAYAENNLDLNNLPIHEHFKSLSICIINCIYSLRANYRTTTWPIVKRYADKFLGGDAHKEGETVSDLINNIDNNGGYESFAVNILKNRQVIGGQLKSLVCYNLAYKLKELDINDMYDFRNYNDMSKLEKELMSVRGVGPAAMNYLFMLVGDQNRVKYDVHIARFIEDAIGVTLNPDEVQELFTEAVKLLKVTYPNITVTALDNIIWQKYSAK